MLQITRRRRSPTGDAHCSRRGQVFPPGCLARFGCRYVPDACPAFDTLCPFQQQDYLLPSRRTSLTGASLKGVVLKSSKEKDCNMSVAIGMRERECGDATTTPPRFNLHLIRASTESPRKTCRTKCTRMSIRKFLTMPECIFCLGQPGYSKYDRANTFNIFS